VAKRFTDTGKWRKEWFRTLPPKMKCAWFFLCDECDHAGIWEISWDNVKHFVGEPVSWDECVRYFGDRLRLLPDGKLFVSGFIEFQYGAKPKIGTNAQRSALQLLRKSCRRLRAEGRRAGAILGLPNAWATLVEEEEEEAAEGEEAVEAEVAVVPPQKKGLSLADSPNPRAKKKEADFDFNDAPGGSIAGGLAP
jgi:hypothetical protein